MNFQRKVREGHATGTGAGTHKAKGEPNEYPELVTESMRETREFLLGGNENPVLDQRMGVDEIIHAQMSELPADYPDRPCANAIEAMRRTWPID